MAQTCYFHILQVHYRNSWRHQAHARIAWNTPLVQVSWFDRVVVELGAVQIQKLVRKHTLDTIFLS